MTSWAIASTCPRSRGVAPVTEAQGLLGAGLDLREPLVEKVADGRACVRERKARIDLQRAIEHVQGRAVPAEQPMHGTIISFEHAGEAVVTGRVNWSLGMALR